MLLTLATIEFCKVKINRDWFHTLASLESIAETSRLSRRTYLTKVKSRREILARTLSTRDRKNSSNNLQMQPKLQISCIANNNTYSAAVNRVMRRSRAAIQVLSAESSLDSQVGSPIRVTTRAQATMLQVLTANEMNLNRIPNCAKM